MKTTKEIEDTLKTAGPGTVLEIKGYTDSSGEVRDLTVELIDTNAYAVMQEQDVRLLEAAVVEELFNDKTKGDLQMPDFIAARYQLLDSRRASLRKREAGETEYHGPAYVTIGGSLQRQQDNQQAVYLQRLKLLSDLGESKPAKGAVPRAKQQMAQRLDLPTRRYVHSLKFENGKFESVRAKILVVVS